MGTPAGFIGMLSQESFWIYDMFKLICFFVKRTRRFEDVNLILLKFFVQDKFEHGLMGYIESYKDKNVYFETFKNNFNKDVSIKVFIEYMIAQFPFLREKIVNVH